MNGDAQATNKEKIIQVSELIDDFSTAMLITQTESGKLRARPMQIASHDDTDLWFVSGKTSGKVEEMSAHPQVCVTMQSGSKFVSLSGRMGLHDDRTLIDQMWHESWKVWFPKGKEDPEIVLLRFDSAEGEYWDNSGAKGLGLLVEYGRAYWKGERPKVDGNVHGKVRT